MNAWNLIRRFVSFDVWSAKLVGHEEAEYFYVPLTVDNRLMSSENKPDNLTPSVAGKIM